MEDKTTTQVCALSDITEVNGKKIFIKHQLFTLISEGQERISGLSTTLLQKPRKFEVSACSH